jgi:hypothetical protein
VKRTAIVAKRHWNRVVLMVSAGMVSSFLDVLFVC